MEFRRVSSDLKQKKNEAREASGQIVLDRLTSGIDEDLAAFQTAQDAKAAQLSDRLDKGKISEEEYKDEIEKLEKKSRIEAAKAEKKKALYDIGIATAVGIAKDIPNIPLMIVAAALGAIQATVVASKPIPKFEHGTNGQLKMSTDAIVSEGGQELVKRPNMPDMLTPINESKIHLPKGAEVLPNYHPETQAALSGGMSEEYYKGLIKSNNRIEKAVRAKNVQPIITPKGVRFINEETGTDILWIKNTMR